MFGAVGWDRDGGEWKRGEMGTYLCSEPEKCRGETDAGRREEGGGGEVEGEEDYVPEKILEGKVN